MRYQRLPLRKQSFHEHWNKHAQVPRVPTMEQSNEFPSRYLYPLYLLTQTIRAFPKWQKCLCPNPDPLNTPYNY
jgi:hypothetical protein